MGSFSFTCSFSKLPIPAGTPVRLFLLTKNPYEDRSVGCEQTTFWVPRSFPIKGEYDECGSIDRVETSLASRAMTGLLAIDGNDIPFSKDAKTGRRTVELEGLLSSIACGKGSVLRNRDRGHVRYLPELPEETEARVKKSAENEKLWRETVKPKKLAKGLPTKARVKRALAAAGLKVDGNGMDGFSVRNMKFGQVRVKYVPWGLNQEALDKAVTALTKKGYAAMAVAGSYESEGVVLVRPKPGNPDYREIKYKEPKTTAPLSFSMVREDVWQALAGVTLPPYCGSKAKTLAGTRESVQAWWDFNMKVPEKDRYFARNEVPQEIMSDVWGIHEDKVPYQMGIASAFEYAVERFKEGSATQEEVNAFLDTVAEFLFVSDVLFFSCRDWTPPTSCGTQEAVWEHSVLFLDAVSGVAHGHYKKELAEREEEEREEREREAKAAAKKARKEKKAELWGTTPSRALSRLSRSLGESLFASTSFARYQRRIGFISSPTLSGCPGCFPFGQSTTTTGRSWTFKRDPSGMSGWKGCSLTWPNGSKGRTPTTTFPSKRE